MQPFLPCATPRVAMRPAVEDGAGTPRSIACPKPRTLRLGNAAWGHPWVAAGTACAMPCLTTFLVLLCAVGGAAQEGLPVGWQAIPDGWTLVSHVDVPAAEVARIGTRLGAPLVALTNTIFGTGRGRAQVNLLTARDPKAAADLEAALARFGKAPLALRRRGSRVAEFVGPELGDFGTALRALGWGRARHRVVVTLGLVDGAEGSAATRVFTLFLRRPEADEAGRARLEEEIATLAKPWKRVDTLTLFTPDRENLKVTIVDAPGATKTEHEGEYTRLTFAEPQLVAGIPVARVTLDVTTSESDAGDGSSIDPSALSAATGTWPAGAPPVRALAGESDASSPAGRDLALDVLLRVRRAVPYGGTETGSRQGVLQAIASGQGHCWDLADVYVACCRTRGLPARQVAGWLLGASGHVWTEVHLPGEGWVTVDPTAGFIGATTRHLPFLATDDGRLSILHVAWPEITERP